MSDKYFNERKSGKIQQFGYDEIIVDPLSTDSCNYCLQRNEVEALLAAIEPLRWKTRWYSASNVDLNQDLIEAFSDGLRWKLMNDCCANEDRIVRVNDNGTIEVSTDGGSSFHPADGTDDSRVTTPTSPALPGDDDSAKKCLGANSVTTWVLTQALEMSNKQTAGGTLLEIIGAAIAVFLLVIAAPAIAFIGPFLVEVVGQIIAAGGSTWYAAMSACADEFNCLVFCVIESDASFTEADCDDLLSRIDGSSMGDSCKRFYSSQVKILRSKGLTNAARGGYGGSRSCDGCSCAPCDLFEIGNIEGNTAFGTDLGTFSGYRRFEAELFAGDGHYYLTLKTPSASECCSIIDVVMQVGSLPTAQVIDCGTAQLVANVHVASTIISPEAGAFNYLAFNGTAPYTVDFLFSA